MKNSDCEVPTCFNGWVAAEHGGGHKGDERRRCPRCGLKEEVKMTADLEPDLKLDVCSSCDRLGKTYSDFDDLCGKCMFSKALSMLNEVMGEQLKNG